LFVNENQKHWASSPLKRAKKVLPESGENQMEIARLQPLNLTKWGPVIDATTAALDDIKTGSRFVFELTFLGTAFSPNPYMQARLNDAGHIGLELVSNHYLVTKISKWHESQLRVLGFKVPDINNPNYHREAMKGDNSLQLARLMIDTARRIYDLTDDAWFTFGAGDEDKGLNFAEAFWHNCENPSILCLPGMNPDHTIEGN
jgi:hypothetical protein